MKNILYHICDSVCVGKGFAYICSYMHFNPQLRSGIRKLQDLMNGPFNRSRKFMSYCTKDRLYLATAPIFLSPTHMKFSYRCIHKTNTIGTAAFTTGLLQI